MPNGIRNWCYADVTKFLKESGFVFYEQRAGSHEAWINLETEAVVEIQFHGNKVSFVLRTLETMIRQSKIDKSEWRKWASK